MNTWSVVTKHANAFVRGPGAIALIDAANQRCVRTDCGNRAGLHARRRHCFGRHGCRHPFLSSLSRVHIQPASTCSLSLNCIVSLCIMPCVGAVLTCSLNASLIVLGNGLRQPCRHPDRLLSSCWSWRHGCRHLSWHCSRAASMSTQRTCQSV